MITLITGTPGAGKTAFALDMMIRQGRLDNSRKLYVHGIPELKVPHEIVTCDSVTCDYCCTLPTSQKAFVRVPKKVNSWDSSTGLFNSLDLSIVSNADLVQRDIEITYKKAEDWHLYAEHGAILFFDEVQNIHRPRNSSAAVPESIAAYEVHRHRGLDFFIITQNPSLIDGNLRALVSRHIHLTSSWARRIQYEFPQCKTDLGATVGEGIKSSYKLPVGVFQYYKSASLHTKLERKRPFAFYAIPVLILILGGLIYAEVNNFKNKGKLPESSSKPTKQTGEGMRDAPASRVNAPVDNLLPASYSPPAASKQVLDMPVLFRRWSQSGIPDDDLKFLPLHMCAVSSANSVRCSFPSNFSFRHYFSNIACTPDRCIGFFPRILPIPEDKRVRPRKDSSPSPPSAVVATN